jgi:hypothetical protein
MLLVIALVLGFVTGKPTRPPSFTRLVSLCLLAGILFSWLSTYWLSLFYLQGSSVIYSDLIEYCTGVTAPRALEAGVSAKRSVFPMLLPRAFYDQYGFFDALALGALCSNMAIGMLLFLWGTLLGGVQLGMCTILLALVPAPMTFIGRMLTTYPEMSLCFIFGAVSAFWGITSKRPSAMFVGGIGVGITLLADTRGIVWAFPFAFGLAISALCRGSWSNRFIRIICLTLPIIYSHNIASSVYVFDAIGIEQQVDMRPMLYRWAKLYPPPWDYPSNFTWGMNPLSEFPKTVQFLVDQGNLDVPDELVSTEVMRGREIAYWYFLFAGIGGFFALIRWRREPWKLFALLVSLSPFLIGFRGALTMLEEHTRFYIQTLPGVIILWAVAWQSLVDIGAFFSPFQWRKTSFLHLPSQSTLCLLLVLGAIPSILSPTSEWRREWSGTDDGFRDILSRYENKSMHRDPMQRFCRRSLDKNIRENRPLTVTLYNQSFFAWWQNQNRTDD